MMGAREVLASCAGWLMVSASRITSCRDLASSNILSISLWTSAAQTTHREIYQVWTLLTDSCTRGRAHLSWSECWIAPWWAVCWGPTSWLKKDPPLHEWLRFCRKTRRKKTKYTNCFQSDLFRLSTLLFCSACCWPSLESVFQKVKQSFLHHVRHLGNTRNQALLKGHKIVFFRFTKDHHC